MNDDLQAVVTEIIARAPEWIRADLASKDPAARQRAEEAFAAKIADALGLTSSAAQSL
ncbi:MAG: DUF6771 family protein [Sphingomonas sp.]